MRLDNDEKEFAVNIRRAALSIGILDIYVEKDYWLFLLLKEIFKNDKRGYVFKGGTSLSKCHHIINRFSEDIDISYSASFSSINSGEIKRKFKGITGAIKAIGLEIANAERLRWNRYFNQFQCPYVSHCKDESINKQVIIELAAQTPSFPSEEKVFSSFIGDYFESIGHHDWVIKYELEPFPIQVQTLERTLIDKTFAICDYYLTNKCRKHSRHLYDISKLLTEVNLNQDLASLYIEVREIRKKIKVCVSAKDGVFLHEILTKIIEEETFKGDYESLTMPLLYENYTYKQCEQSLVMLRDFLRNSEESLIVNLGLNDLKNNKVIDGEEALKAIKEKYNL